MGAPVDPDWQQRAFHAERVERGDLLLLRGQPRQVGVLDHVVEREEAPDEHGGGRGAAVADVLRAERPVELPGVDPAHAPDSADAWHGLLGGEPLRDQRVHEPPCPFMVRVQEPGRLRAG